jgi:SAM-dependent methyltransferase
MGAMTAEITAGNDDQVAHWNAAAGESWAALSDRLDRMVGPLGEIAMDALALDGGGHVVDIGCGCGQTTLELAHRLGESGEVLGIDVSVPMLDVAKARAERAGLANVRFLESDAQTHPFEAGAVNAAFSRFGVMFFSDPVAAFANIHNALSSRGRLAFVCWRAMDENPLMTIPMRAALLHVPEPPATLADLFAPGPFAFADRDRLFGILASAGLRDIEITPHDQPLTTGDVEQTIEISMRIGPLGRLLRERPDLVSRVAPAVREAVDPHRTESGVFFDSATWIVTARKETHT